MDLSFLDDLDEEDGVCPDGGGDENDRRVYPHGYSVRLRLLTTEAEGYAAVERLGWAADSPDWRSASLKGGVARWSIRGATFLTQRRPMNKALPLARLNKKWSTAVYSLMFEDHDGELFLDVHGVRWSDVDRLAQRIMCLAPDQYRVEYLRAIEAFVVLSPADAAHLADALGAAPSSGRGRSARKEYAVRDHVVPITIRSRTRRSALLSVYRIRGGATHQFKCELRLSGKKRDRSHFELTDRERLERCLLDLVAHHQLSPLKKPARWEPRQAKQPARDERLARLSAKVYRGRPVSEHDERLIERICHTDRLRFVTESALNTVDPARPECIRAEREPYPSPTAVNGPHSAVNGPHSAVSADILRHSGVLVEVALDAEESPGQLIEALAAHHPPDSLSVTCLCAGAGADADLWDSVRTAIRTFPLRSTTQTLVLVVDNSIAVPIEGAITGWSEPLPAMEDEAGLTRFIERGTPIHGPFVHPGYRFPVGTLMIRAVAALLSPMMKELSALCEATGLRIVVVTTDARPARGSAEVQHGDYFRDGQVRTFCGDATRRWAHARYRIEPGRRRRQQRAVMIKDEFEGAMGRVLWGPKTGTWTASPFGG